MTTARVKGTNAETAVVDFIRLNGFPQAERRALHGDRDLGDITGTPGLCWEVKAGSRLCIPQWLRETEVERLNAHAEMAVLVVKPRGVGALRTGQWWAIKPLEAETLLLRAAGFGEPL